MSGHRFALPAVIRRSPSGLAYFLYWAPFILAYQITNRWPLVEPRPLPLTTLDQAIPFWPALLPIYVAYLPLFWWTVMRSRDDAEVNLIFHASYLQLVLSLPFFLLVPITMPRELYYGADAHNWADSFWRWFDAPNNCFPSLHVANALMLAYFNWTRPWAVAHVTLSALIVASTVLVKQHYVVDVIGGAVVFGVALWIIRRVDIVPWRHRRAARELGAEEAGC